MESEVSEKGLRMVKTCANPACAVPFLYWRGGRLFRFDVKAQTPRRDVPEQIREVEARPEFGLLLAVREVLLHHDSQFRSTPGPSHCAAKECETPSQCDWSDRSARA